VAKIERAFAGKPERSAAGSRSRAQKAPVDLGSAAEPIPNREANAGKVDGRKWRPPHRR
jgi:hypothetical protein